MEILIIGTNLKKSNLGWPQQPPTENVGGIKKLYFMIPLKKWVSKHQNKVKFKNLDDSQNICYSHSLNFHVSGI